MNNTTTIHYPALFSNALPCCFFTYAYNRLSGAKHSRRLPTPEPTKETPHRNEANMRSPRFFDVHEYGNS